MTVSLFYIILNRILFFIRRQSKRRHTLDKFHYFRTCSRPKYALNEQLKNDAVKITSGSFNSIYVSSRESKPETPEPKCKTCDVKQQRDDWFRAATDNWSDIFVPKLWIMLPPHSLAASHVSVKVTELWIRAASETFVTFKQQNRSVIERKPSSF